MKIFTSLDELPIYNFWKVRMTGDLSYLFDCDDLDKAQKKLKRKVWRGIVVDAWDKMESEFIENFAMDEEYMTRLIIEKKIALLQLDYMITKKSVYRSRMKAEQQKLDLNYRVEEKPKVKLAEFLTSIEKYVGFPIDEKRTSTNKVYFYVMQMQKAAKDIENKKQSKNG